MPKHLSTLYVENNMDFQTVLDLGIAFGSGSIFAIALLLHSNRCKHEYGVYDVLDKSNGPMRSKVYVQRCNHCGKLKKKEVK